MKKYYHNHNPLIYTSVLLFIVLGSLLCSRASHAQPLPGTQLAYFVGYHSGGMYKGNNYNRPNKYYAPRYHYRGAYKTPWTSVGHTCPKKCVLDRWTGKAIRCYRTC